MKKMNVKLECAVCPTKIWDNSTAKIKKGSEYNEASIELSNGSSMTIGVCSEHVKLNSTQLSKVTDKMHAGWLEEVYLGIANVSWVENTGLKLKAVGVK